MDVSTVPSMDASTVPLASFLLQSFCSPNPFPEHSVIAPHAPYCIYYGVWGRYVNFDIALGPFLTYFYSFCMLYTIRRLPCDVLCLVPNAKI